LSAISDYHDDEFVCRNTDRFGNVVVRFDQASQQSMASGQQPAGKENYHVEKNRARVVRVV
jgi:hypothetical protein